MNRWVFASCGKQPKWYLADPEKINETITEHFGVGADSLDESSLIEDEIEDDTVEDEDAAIIRFVNEVILKPSVTVQPIFILNRIEIPYKFATESMVN